jgi:hypothetical protein
VVRIQTTPAGRQFVTKGDANSVEDPWRIAATPTVWHAVTVIHQSATLIRFAHSKVARWLAQMVPALLIVAALLSWLWRPSRATRQPRPNPAAV